MLANGQDSGKEHMIDNIVQTMQDNILETILDHMLATTKKNIVEHIQINM